MAKGKRLGPKLPVRDDAHMINHPDLWPLWPWLPIKRYNKTRPYTGPECALIQAGARTVAVLTNLHTLPATAEEFDALPRMRYTSVEAMLADGWVVD